MTGFWNYKSKGFPNSQSSNDKMFTAFQYFFNSSFFPCSKHLYFKSNFISFKGIKFFCFMYEIPFFFSRFFIDNIYKSKTLELFIYSDYFIFMVSFLDFLFRSTRKKDFLFFSKVFLLRFFFLKPK